MLTTKLTGEGDSELGREPGRAGKQRHTDVSKINVLLFFFFSLCWTLFSIEKKPLRTFFRRGSLEPRTGLEQSPKAAPL